MKIELFFTIVSWIIFVFSSLLMCISIYMGFKYQGSIEQKRDRALGQITKFYVFRFAIPAIISLVWIWVYYFGN